MSTDPSATVNAERPATTAGAPAAGLLARRSRPRGGTQALRDLGILGAAVVLFIVLSVSSDVFLRPTNLLNVLAQWSPVMIMSVGATIVLITGGFDLSVGGMYTVAGIVAVKVGQDVSVIAGVAAGVLSGFALGSLNGALGTVGRINVFVATLGTSILFSGFADAITGGTTQIVDDPSYGFMSNEFLGINLSIWTMLVFSLLAAAVLARTTLGRYFFAVGGNEEAARLAGIRVYWVRASAFAIAGLAAGIAAFMVSSRSSSAGSAGSTDIAFNVWTAMLLGGNSMAGGEGAVWRTAVGVALIALISNGFNLLGVDPTYQQVATGAILLLAVGLDAWTRRRRA